MMCRQRGCSCGHVKESYIAGDISYISFLDMSRNPKEKTCMFGAAERETAIIGEKVGKIKIKVKTFIFKQKMYHKTVFLVLGTLTIAQA